MGLLELTLLGGFKAALPSQQAVSVGAKKNQALLAYLALNPGRLHGRDKLIDLLWSDRDNEHGRNSLRQALTALRKDLAAIEPQPITVEGEVLTVSPSSIMVDVLAFERLARSDAVEDLKEAAALYKGELLDGLAIRDASFVQWLVPERQRVRELAIEVQSRLIVHLSGAAAIEAAHRLVELDPLREASQRVLIELLAESGEIEAALAQCRRYGALLERDLRMQPSAAMQALSKEIAAGRLTEQGGTVSPIRKFEHRLNAKRLIAVLPLENRSLDPQHQDLCDVLSGDISDALSRITKLQLVAHTSMAIYRGKMVDVREVARDFGIDYVIQGSVHRLGEHLRINIQLSDAPRGLHLWAEQYDCTLPEIAEIQDTICRAVASSTETQIDLSAKRLSAATERLAIDDLYALGVSLLYEETAEAYDEAWAVAERAIEIAPRHPRSNLLKAEVHVDRLCARVDEFDSAVVAEGLRLSRAALAMAPHEEWAHLCVARACIEAEDIDTAIVEAERALELNPSLSNGIARRGECYALLGRSADAIAAGRLALKLNPRHPTNHWRHFTIALAHFAAGDDGEALQEATRVLHQRSDYVRAATIVAASAAQLGRNAEAAAAVALLRSRYPDLRSSAVAPRLMPRFARSTDRDRLTTGLRVAGLQE